MVFRAFKRLSEYWKKRREAAKNLVVVEETLFAEAEKIFAKYRKHVHGRDLIQIELNGLLLDHVGKAKGIPVEALAAAKAIEAKQQRFNKAWLAAIHNKKISVKNARVICAQFFEELEGFTKRNKSSLIGFQKRTILGAMETASKWSEEFLGKQDEELVAPPNKKFFECASKIFSNHLASLLGKGNLRYYTKLKLITIFQRPKKT